MRGEPFFEKRVLPILACIFSVTDIFGENPFDKRVIPPPRLNIFRHRSDISSRACSLRYVRPRTYVGYTYAEPRALTSDCSCLGLRLHMKICALDLALQSSSDEKSATRGFRSKNVSQYNIEGDASVCLLLREKASEAPSGRELSA